MGVRAERSSPLWVFIHQNALAVARDFWNTHSDELRSTETSTGNTICISYMAFLEN